MTQQGTVPDGTGTPPPGAIEAPMDAPMSMPMPQGTPMSQGNMATAMAQPAGNYPACSRTVTDRCVQTYERGVRRARRR